MGTQLTGARVMPSQLPQAVLLSGSLHPHHPPSLCLPHSLIHACKAHAMQVKRRFLNVRSRESGIILNSRLGTKQGCLGTSLCWDSEREANLGQHPI
jgi:hypothetical protein